MATMLVASTASHSIASAGPRVRGTVRAPDKVKHPTLQHHAELATSAALCQTAGHKAN